MGFSEGRLLVAVEASSFKPKASACAQLVTLGTCRLCSRMFDERRKVHRRLRAGEEAYFLLTAFPLEHKRVLARRHIHDAVKHVGKGLRHLD